MSAVSAVSPGWRLAARLARREVRRRPWRTTLVVALVAVPVAAMLVMVGTLRVGELTRQERWVFNYGAADGVSFADRPPSGLPDGSRVRTYRTTWGSFETDAGSGCSCTITDVPLDDPITAGAARLTSGRYPRRPGELLLSSSAAQVLDAQVGDATASGRVVGIGRVRAMWREPTVVLAPGSLASGSVTHLVDLPAGLTRRELRAVFQDGDGPYPSPSIDVDVSRVDFASENNNGGVRWTLVGGAVGLSVLGIVVVAAFAVSARRQLVTLGQLAANGAEPATLRRVLFLQGTIAGLVGSVVGLGLGTLVLNVGRDRFVRLTLQDLAGWHVRGTDVLPIVGLGVLAATVAALIPAWSVPRIPVLMALAGRRPERRVPRQVAAAGLAACGAGLGAMGLAVVLSRGGRSPDVWAWAGAGSVVLLFGGVCAAAPAVTVVLDLLAVRLRGPWRLAARSLSRQRARTSAVVAAIAVTSALAIAVATLLVGSKQDRLDDPYPGNLALESAAAGVAFVLALFVVAAMLGLSGAESRDEQELLAAVGAGPRTLRRASACKAVLLTLLGGVLAVPVGYLPVVVYTRADGTAGMPLVFPWRAVALLVVGVPLVAGLLTRFGSGLGQRWRPLEVARLSVD